MLGEYQDKVKILSGGTEVIALMKLRLITPQAVMSLKGLSGLRGIRKQTQGIVIGGATTLSEIIDSPLTNPLLKGLIEAARSVAAPQIRNKATIAGNILQDTRCLFYNQSELVRGGLEPCFKLRGHLCRAVSGANRCFSVYQGDLAPALIAFGAKARLEKEGTTRTVLVSGLFSGDGREPISIEKDELLTHIIIPPPQGRFGSSYQKLRMRGSIDYPLASVASVVHADDGGHVVDARVVIGAAGPSPRMVERPASPEGKKPLDEWIEDVAQGARTIAEAVNNQPLPGSYRTKMIKVLTKRALNDSLAHIEGE